jgi:hypothetical protein
MIITWQRNRWRAQHRKPCCSRIQSETLNPDVLQGSTQAIGCIQRNPAEERLGQKSAKAYPRDFLPCRLRDKLSVAYSSVRVYDKLKGLDGHV